MAVVAGEVSLGGIDIPSGERGLGVGLNGGVGLRMGIKESQWHHKKQSMEIVLQAAHLAEEVGPDVVPVVSGVPQVQPLASTSIYWHLARERCTKNIPTHSEARCGSVN